MSNTLSHTASLPCALVNKRGQNSNVQILSKVTGEFEETRITLLCGVVAHVPLAVPNVTAYLLSASVPYGYSVILVCW